MERYRVRIRHKIVNKLWDEFWIPAENEENAKEKVNVWIAEGWEIFDVEVE